MSAKRIQDMLTVVYRALRADGEIDSCTLERLDAIEAAALSGDESAIQDLVDMHGRL